VEGVNLLWIDNAGLEQLIIVNRRRGASGNENDEWILGGQA